MNYDGKANVIDLSKYIYFKVDGSAYCYKHNDNNNITLLNNSFDQNSSVTVKVRPSNIVKDKIKNNTAYCFDTNINPSFKAYISNNNKHETYFGSFKTIIKYDKYRSYNKSFKKIKTDILLEKPIVKNVEIFTSKKCYIINSSSSIDHSKTFNSKRINIIDKSEIKLPDIDVSTGGLEKFSIVVQKNEFLQLSFKDNINNIVPKLEGFEILGNVLKGVFGKSGEYNITLYFKGYEQKLNIIVPQYQRLL